VSKAALCNGLKSSSIINDKLFLFDFDFKMALGLGRPEQNCLVKQKINTWLELSNE
jgi:hypothetical protein